MADGDESDLDYDPGDHSPDPTQPVDRHGYDAIFFVVATLVAIGFVVALYFFKG